MAFSFFLYFDLCLIMQRLVDISLRLQRTQKQKKSKGNKSHIRAAYSDYQNGKLHGQDMAYSVIELFLELCGM